MNIWLIRASEPLPLNPEARTMRMGMIAQILHQRGHKVLWWASSFDHFEKKYYTDKFEIRQIKSNYDIAILHPKTPYYKNVSFARLRNHSQLATSFRSEARKLPPPDLIITSFPTVDLSKEAIDYGLEHKVPVITDIRDLWPDIFLELFPKITHPLFKLLLTPMELKTKYIIKKSTQIMGITQEYIDWACAKANRPHDPNDLPTALGYSDSPPAYEDLQAAEDFWEKLFIKKDDFNLCFFGSLGKQFDIETIIRAASIIQEQNLPKIKFIICGNGESLPKYKERSENLTNILFPGRINKNQIYALLRASQIGLAPYCNHIGFLLNLPNKIAEYFSASLPILSSLEGTIGRLIRKNHCGIVYKYNDAQDLANKIIELYNDPDRLTAMKSNASELFKNEFEASQVYNNFAKKIENLFSKEKSCS